MQNKTSVDEIDTINVCNLENEIIDINLSVNEIRKNAIDLFIPILKRIEYLYLYLEKDKEQFGELISCLCGMYSFSRTISLKEYIKAISNSNYIPIIYRIECCKNLDKEGFLIINEICKNENFKLLPTPIRAETVIYLMKHPDYNESSRNYFTEITNDQFIDCIYRFKLIQQLENYFKEELFYFYIDYITTKFLENENNQIFIKVICCQYMFQKCSQTLFNFINNFLITTASMVELDEDIRADACDILLAFGTPENVENARLILFVLGGGERARTNIFKNSQNVHTLAIEESIEKIIEFLAEFIPKNGNIYTFEKTKDELEEKIKVHKDYEILKESLIRIIIDRAIYGKLNMTLSTIITKLWTYIQDSEYREELEKRLFEELIDSKNKCSSGYVGRLVNTLSGFSNLSVQIGFDDQIITILETRLNNKIMAMTDENEIDLILDEMILPVRFYDKRGNFLKFFRTHISKIREEIYLEFKNYITDQDFDLFFRKAISHYEGIN